MGGRKDSKQRGKKRDKNRGEAQRHEMAGISQKKSTPAFLLNTDGGNQKATSEQTRRVESEDRLGNRPDDVMPVETCLRKNTAAWGGTRRRNGEAASFTPGSRFEELFGKEGQLVKVLVATRVLYR